MKILVTFNIHEAKPSYLNTVLNSNQAQENWIQQKWSIGCQIPHLTTKVIIQSLGIKKHVQSLDNSIYCTKKKSP